MVENIDKYGNCIICHKSLLIERVVDQKVMRMFTPEYDETEYLLNDGSRMRVCICKPCKATVDLSDDKVKDQIMEAVINGWDLETKAFVDDPLRPDWTEEKQKEHMDIYSKKSLDVHSEGLSKHVIEDHKKRLQGVLNGSDK